EIGIDVGGIDGTRPQFVARQTTQRVGRARNSEDISRYIVTRPEVDLNTIREINREQVPAQRSPRRDPLALLPLEYNSPWGPGGCDLNGVDAVFGIRKPLGGCADGDRPGPMSLERGIDSPLEGLGGVLERQRVADAGLRK